MKSCRAARRIVNGGTGNEKLIVIQKKMKKNRMTGREKTVEKSMINFRVK